VTSDNTDHIYIINIIDDPVTPHAEAIDLGPVIDDGQDNKPLNIQGADLVFASPDVGGALYLWTNGSGTNFAARGLYSLFLPPASGYVSAHFIGAGGITRSFTGLALREFGTSDYLVGSVRQTGAPDWIYELSKTNPSINNIYVMYLAGSSVPYNYEYGDMTTGGLSGYEPIIDIVKSGPYTASEGDIITYTYQVSTAGNDIPLSSVTVWDDLAGDAAYFSGDDNYGNILDPVETWIFIATYTIPEDSDNPVVNTATATGYYLGIEVSDADSWEVTIVDKGIPGVPESTPGKSVGVDVYQTDKAALIAPWIALTATIISGSVFCRPSAIMGHKQGH